VEMTKSKLKLFWQLPLPHLKVGYLTAPPVGNSLAPHSDWKRTEFELNHERLLQVFSQFDYAKK